MTRTADLAAHERTIVEAILRTHAPRPCAISVFGSRAGGRPKRFSDLDLALDAGRELTLAERARLADAFEESPLPWRVDIVDLVACSPRFRAIIETTALPFLILPEGAA